MKILKQGKSKEEVDRIIKRVRHFECSTCGCVFEADNTEYISIGSAREKRQNGGSVNVLIVASSPTSQYRRDESYILFERSVGLCGLAMNLGQ